jgi:hypothetical protein
MNCILWITLWLIMGYIGIFLGRNGIYYDSSSAVECLVVWGLLPLAGFVSLIFGIALCIDYKKGQKHEN